MDKENPQKPKKPQHTDLGKYSGMAFQMGITIALGTWGGIKLDEYLGFKKFPVFTITLSLSAVIVSMYFVIKGITKK